MASRKPKSYEHVDFHPVLEESDEQSLKEEGVELEVEVEATPVIPEIEVLNVQAKLDSAPEELPKKEMEQRDEKPLPAVTPTRPPSPPKRSLPRNTPKFSKLVR